MAKTPASETVFIDDRLAPGANYCYRIVAQFPNPGRGTSYISEEVCLILDTDAPVITHVDILETSEDGRIKIDWTPPYEIDVTTFPSPYTYSLYRAAGFYLDEEVLVAEKISDTLFVDQVDLNTVDYAYAYRIALFDANNFFVDSSAVASSVQLNAKPLLNVNELSWQANVPWSNNILAYPYHYVYRDRVNTSDPDLMILIDSVKISENGFNYLDDGRFNNTVLDDKLIYCYALTTYGGYDNLILPAPLVNNSQVVCAQPNIQPLFLKKKEVLFYPNPTDDIINIKMAEFKEATIYNLSGKIIMRSTDNRIDVSELSEGVYIIKLENRSGDRFSTRLIKE
jgi:hypothetical protein